MVCPRVPFAMTVVLAVGCIPVTSIAGRPAPALEKASIFGGGGALLDSDWNIAGTSEAGERGFFYPFLGVSGPVGPRTDLTVQTTGGDLSVYVRRHIRGDALEQREAEEGHAYRTAISLDLGGNLGGGIGEGFASVWIGVNISKRVRDVLPYLTMRYHVGSVGNTGDVYESIPGPGNYGFNHAMIFLGAYYPRRRTDVELFLGSPVGIEVEDSEYLVKMLGVNVIRWSE